MSGRTGRIHAARLTGRSAPALYYRALKAAMESGRDDGWVSVDVLQGIRKSSAIGTRIAEIRGSDDFPVIFKLEHRKEKRADDTWRVWYRVARREGLSSPPPPAPPGQQMIFRPGVVA